MPTIFGEGIDDGKGITAVDGKEEDCVTTIGGGVGTTTKGGVGIITGGGVGTKQGRGVGVTIEGGVSTIIGGGVGSIIGGGVASTIGMDGDGNAWVQELGRGTIRVHYVCQE